MGVQVAADLTRRMHYAARALAVIWVVWILAEWGVPLCTALTLGDITAVFWLVLLISAAIPWRWESIGGVILLTEGSLLLLCGLFDTSLLPRALLPMVSGFLFFMSWKSETPEGVNRQTLLRMIFKITGHLFVVASMLLIATKGRQLYVGVFTIVPALLGYLNVLCVIQSVSDTLRKSLSLPCVLLAIAYSMSGLFVVVIIYLLSFTIPIMSVPIMSMATDTINYTALIVTAVMGLTSAASGILAQTAAG
jgi:hypothetical protein